MKNNFIMKPKVDFCFKELMEEDEVRRGFLAAVLGIRPEEIVETKLLPTHLRKVHKEDKLGILDVRVVLNNREQIDMEIQVDPFDQWPERSLFYLAKIYVDQIHEGEDYNKLKKCIHIGVLNFELFPEDEGYYSRFHIWEDCRREKYTDKFEIHILELPKLKKYDYPESELLNWTRFMNAEKEEEFQMLAKKDEYIEKAYEKLTKISADEQKRLEYEAREKAIRDYNWQMKCSHRRGYEEGVKDASIKTFIEAGKKFGVSRDAVLQELMAEQKLTDDEAEKYMKEYWKTN
ncbi:MAG: Rpn family recombination-promoting nuclease/putative transposase [Ruminococcus sp.]|nr:Rpn family recombination-promoting nuclease/putative transposase [Ruminococcus sp.]